MVYETVTFMERVVIKTTGRRMTIRLQCIKSGKKKLYHHEIKFRGSKHVQFRMIDEVLCWKFNDRELCHFRYRTRTLSGKTYKDQSVKKIHQKKVRDGRVRRDLRDVCRPSTPVSYVTSCATPLELQVRMFTLCKILNECTV